MLALVAGDSRGLALQAARTAAACWLSLAACWLPLAACRLLGGDPTLRFGESGPGDLPDVRYETKNFSSLVDHFSFGSNRRFAVRYLVNSSFHAAGGPLLLYAGNEGSIETFASNTLIMWQLAPQLRAGLVFVEHRYYGNSMPFGSRSFDNASTVAYLTAEQALADYAYFLENLPSLEPRLGADPAPVVAFGGSYGGMLAAWLRHKYPHLVAGAIAASAPVRQFLGVTDCYAFMRTVTKAFGRWDSECPRLIRASWPAMQRVGSGAAGLRKLGSIFRTCQPPGSVRQLADWLSDAYVTVAMVNYPYPADFLLPLPAWPVKRMCERLKQRGGAGAGVGVGVGDDVSLLRSLSLAAAVYYNYSGRAACLNLTASATSLDDRGWSVQSCNEMAMPDSCADGEGDMFRPTGDFNVSAYAEACERSFGVRPRPRWAVVQFGGVADPVACSNIFFTNGDLDPWSCGGVLRSPNSACPAFVMRDAAHHLDLRAPDPRDPPDVAEARRRQLDAVRGWIRQFRPPAAL